VKFLLSLIFIDVIKIGQRVAKKTPPATGREHVTLPKFTLHQLSEMVGAYEATRPEVIAWIVQTWLHENRDKVQQQIRAYRDYVARDSSGDGQK
jgi:metal-responsive CopG/Arc/MetJ family transcriptional regulator